MSELEPQEQGESVRTLAPVSSRLYWSSVLFDGVPALAVAVPLLADLPERVDRVVVPFHVGFLHEGAAGAVIDGDIVLVQREAEEAALVFVFVLIADVLDALVAEKLLCFGAHRAGEFLGVLAPVHHVI